MLIMAERVNHPPHYNAGGIECIDALEAATSGLQGIEAFCTANAIKYLWRWKLKNGEEDAAISQKHEYNKSRPYRHGGKKC